MSANVKDGLEVHHLAMQMFCADNFNRSIESLAQLDESSTAVRFLIDARLLQKPSDVSLQATLKVGLGAPRQ